MGEVWPVNEACAGTGQRGVWCGVGWCGVWAGECVALLGRVCRVMGRRSGEVTAGVSEHIHVYEGVSEHVYVQRNPAEQKHFLLSNL